MKPLKLILVCASMIGPQIAAAAEEVNVYSYRKPQLIKPMFDQFTDETGIKVNAVFAKKGMLQRLKSEGKNSPADLVFTVDIGRLSDFKNAGLTQPVALGDAEQAVPANLRDAQQHWVGITSRARVIVTSKERVAEGSINSYEDLADPMWKGKICTRSGKHPYNIALIAMMMSVHGEADTEAWLQGVKANLARKPEGNDRGQVKAISEGLCDIAIINHYYIAKMVDNPDQQAWAAAINVVFPNQQDRGTHMNISGVAMTKHAPNTENAKKLMTFLVSDEAQKMYADVNGEYPVDENIQLGGFLKQLGEFKRDTLDLGAIAGNRAAASKMVDRVAFDS